MRRKNGPTAMPDIAVSLQTGLAHVVCSISGIASFALLAVCTKQLYSKLGLLVHVWFVSVCVCVQNAQHNPWLIHFAAKLLINDEDTLGLIEYNPFEGQAPPT